MERFGSGKPITLTNLSVPGCFLGTDEDLVLTELTIDGSTFSNRRGEEVDMQGAIAMPCFVDMHTHLDKGHIWARAPNPDGTFMGALTTVARDRSANWSTNDVRTRMEFSLKCAYAHGTRAIRTHLDSLPPQDEISWPVFAELRQDWAGRIDLQGASLVGCDTFDSIAEGYAATADIVQAAGGVLGMVTYPVPDLRRRLLEFFDLAGNRDLSVDFHCDETMDPDCETLRMIAEVAKDIGWSRTITVGHCCSLSTQDEARAHETLDLVAEQGFNVVSLPMCNLYLQDRHANRTPRNRGITLVHEMAARGINVSFASDNTRDPFYAYGDMDMLEVMRQATRIGHLDHSRADWPLAFVNNPAGACGFAPPSFERDAAANLVIFKARSWTELFARPQSDRTVVRDGAMIDTALPDYAELDHLMEEAS